MCWWLISIFKIVVLFNMLSLRTVWTRYKSYFISRQSQYSWFGRRVEQPFLPLKPWVMGLSNAPWWLWGHTAGTVAPRKPHPSNLLCLNGVQKPHEAAHEEHKMWVVPQEICYSSKIYTRSQWLCIKIMQNISMFLCWIPIEMALFKLSELNKMHDVKRFHLFLLIF